jgi:nicotinic acid mononucleotide adenylyltransferase
MEQAIYNLKRLFALREAVETLDLAAPPTAHIFYPETVPPFRRVGILCGSFNPLTLAHTELAARARETCQLDCVFFTLAKVTVDKEQVTGLGLEDRLLLLSLYARRHDCTGVALVNRGLYFEQAQAFRSLLGTEVELNFVVGMDKLLQILDPRYYQDREAALRQLFSAASLIVANRRDLAQAEFQQLLDRPENRPYRSHVRFCSLPATIADLSATAVRDGLAAGKVGDEHVPAETAGFLAETHAYAPPLWSDNEAIDAYAIRLALLESLYSVRSWAEQEADFRRLLQVALTPSEKGRALRHSATGAAVRELLRS